MALMVARAPEGSLHCLCRLILSVPQAIRAIGGDCSGPTLPLDFRMTDTETPELLLQKWLSLGDNREIDALSRRLAADPQRRTLFKVLALAARSCNKRPIQLDEADRLAAAEALAGWRPDLWRDDQAARTLILLQAAKSLAEKDFHRELNFLFSAADVGELETLYQALALFPQPEQLLPQALEGTRSNMTRVFTALVHHNPYPAAFFDADSWNRMILKTVFLCLPLSPVQRLDERANAELAGMLLDYVRERWAARRTVRPGLWRCVGPFADAPEELAFFQRLIEEGCEQERMAARLSLKKNPHPDVQAILQADRQPLPDSDWEMLESTPEEDLQAHLPGPLAN